MEVFDIPLHLRRIFRINDDVTWCKWTEVPDLLLFFLYDVPTNWREPKGCDNINEQDEVGIGVLSKICWMSTQRGRKFTARL